MDGGLLEPGGVPAYCRTVTLARSCLLAAASLDRQPSLMGTNPFLLVILERTLKLYLTATGGGPSAGEENDGEEDEGPSIIVP